MNGLRSINEYIFANDYISYRFRNTGNSFRNISICTSITNIRISFRSICKSIFDIPKLLGITKNQSRIKVFIAQYISVPKYLTDIYKTITNIPHYLRIFVKYI